MDVERFLQVLGEMRLDLQPVSLALVGYGLSDGDLRARLDSLGLPVGYASTDLHVAADWRNKPDTHSCIIALAVRTTPRCEHARSLSTSHGPRISGRAA